MGLNINHAGFLTCCYFYL